MKRSFLLLVLAVSLFACNNKQEKAADAGSIVSVTIDEGFFPVTSYIKGQIAELISLGVGPVKITTMKGKTDSVWLKQEQFDSVFAPFLTPVIDSMNMKGLFKENRFQDQTINSFTFTYEPLKELPPSMSLKRWDVYVDPQSGKVRSIYMEKYTADKKEMKMTWKSNGITKISYFSTDSAGNSVLEKEELVKWNFDEE